MSLDPNPVFRKMIVAWYNSETASYTVIVFMLIVLLFSIAGMSVAAGTPVYYEFIWVPILLAILSGIIILSAVFHIMRLYSD